MPLPFGDGSFPSCVSHFTGQGDDSELAHKKCGAIQSKIDSAVAAILSEYEIKTGSASWLENSRLTADLGHDQLFEKNGKRFAKIFLISDATNLKQWQVTEASIPRRIRTFIGRPFISEPGLAHFDTDKLPIDQILAKQENFRAGTIRDVVIGSDNTAYAIVEFADNTLGNRTWKEMKEGKAIYSSPAVAGFSFITEGKRLFTDWFGLHLARVSNPAYGVFHASLKQTCEGDEKKCLDMLVASASKYVTDISSNVSPKPHCSKMSTQINFADMTDEEKKKKFEEMQNQNASISKELSELKTKVAGMAGADGVKIVTDPVPPNEKQSGQGQHDTVVMPKGTAAMQDQLKELSTKVAAYEARDKAVLIDKIIEMKATAGLVTASNEPTERDTLGKLTNEQLQSKVADFEPIFEKMMEMSRNAGGMEPQEGRHIVMPKQTGIASASASTKPSSLNELNGSWY